MNFFNASSTCRQEAPTSCRSESSATWPDFHYPFSLLLDEQWPNPFGVFYLWLTPSLLISVTPFFLVVFCLDSILGPTDSNPVSLSVITYWTVFIGPVVQTQVNKGKKCIPQQVVSNSWRLLHEISHKEVFAAVPNTSLQNEKCKRNQNRRRFAFSVNDTPFETHRFQGSHIELFQVFADVPCKPLETKAIRIAWVILVWHRLYDWFHPPTASNISTAGRGI